MNTNHRQTLRPRAGIFMTAATILSLQSAIASIGEFEASSDVGNPAKAGSATYDTATDAYTVAGGGKNIWFDKDEFHYVWRKVKGDFIIQTRAHLVGKGVELHRKLGLMVRPSLDTSSTEVNAVVHGDGLTSLQFRRTTGAKTEEKKSTLTAADVIQLERRGDKYTMSVARFGEPFVTAEVPNLDLGDEPYVGLFVCAHNTNVIEAAVFQDVRLTIPAATNFVPYHDYIGSRLEVLDVDSGRREVLFRTTNGIEAPNWMTDGAALICNSKGRLFNFPLATKQPVPLDTGSATHCNNDHVLSFDGKNLGLSHQPKENGSKSLVYTLPVTGGEPKQITDKAPSYLHGFSPDGKFLLYTGQRDGEFDIYRIPVTGGEETRLTTTKGLDDGSEYSPDGKYIYFNSARTGTMQIWRMMADGSQQEQLTHGEFNDWFPHVSPDGKRIVFISFSKNVPAEKHPYYEHVYLREISTSGGEPKVVAYLYGGQGTINVSSWSPDSKRVAFVSHTGKVE
jgi:regulation of enolase protein 1 (concanavalin A-like superfamily)